MGDGDRVPETVGVLGGLGPDEHLNSGARVHGEGRRLERRVPRAVGRRALDLEGARQGGGHRGPVHRYVLGGLDHPGDLQRVAHHVQNSAGHLRAAPGLDGVRVQAGDELRWIARVHREGGRDHLDALLRGASEDVFPRGLGVDLATVDGDARLGLRGDLRRLHGLLVAERVQEGAVTLRILPRHDQVGRYLGEHLHHGPQGHREGRGGLVFKASLHGNAGQAVHPHGLQDQGPRIHVEGIPRTCDHHLGSHLKGDAPRGDLAGHCRCLPRGHHVRVQEGLDEDPVDRVIAHDGVHPRTRPAGGVGAAGRQDKTEEQKRGKSGPLHR